MEDRYVFLKTTENEGRVVALMGDKHVLGEAGVQSMRLAFNAHAAPLTRAGVLTMTADQLRERLPLLQEQGMTESASAFTKAIDCIQKKQGGGANATVATKMSM